MLAYQPDGPGPVGGGGSRGEHLVSAPVEDRSRVVAHPAIHRDIGANARDVLDGAHRVEGDRRLRHDRPPRLGGDDGVEPGTHCRFVYRLAPLRDGGGVLALHVGHAQPAADGHLPDPQWSGELGDDFDGAAEWRNVEDLAPDMGVDPNQLHGRWRSGPLEGAKGATAGQGNPELRIGGPGPEELVCVGLHPRIDPDRNRRWSQPLGNEGLDAVHLHPGVDHHPAHCGLEAGSQLVGRLVVAMEHQSLGGDPGRQGDVQLAPGGHVEQHSLLVCEPGHRTTEEGLGGVRSPTRERGDGLATASPHVVLVVDEQGSPELAGQVGPGATSDPQPPVVVDGGVVGEKAQR